MEEALTALLLSAAGVTALVSQRIWWGRAPQLEHDYPRVVMQGIGRGRDYTNEGPSGYVASRVQIDVYGQTYTSTKQTARAVTSALSGHRNGALQGIFIDAERDLPAADAGEVQHLFRVQIDIIVHHHN